MTEPQHIPNTFDALVSWLQWINSQQIDWEGIHAFARQKGFGEANTLLERRTYLRPGDELRALKAEYERR